MWRRHLFIYFFIQKKRKKKKNTTLHDWMLHCHWLNKNKYKLDKLNLTRLWVLFTIYQKNTWLFVLVTIYSKIKTKIKPRSIYPKKLNSKARLWNGKVLDTHSAQTGSLLDSNDQCTPLCCMIWMIFCIHETLNQTKSHKSIYECILFFV